MKELKQPNPSWRVILSLLVLSLMCMGAILPAGVEAGLSLTVTPLGGDYRWLIEKDETFHPDPNGPILDPPLNPDPIQGLNFHKSYMPIVAKGNIANGESPATVTLDPDTWYFVSVLPNSAGGYTMGGASFRTDLAGEGAATVNLNALPLPTAQVSVFVFHDNAPINNVADLPQELGLAGFQVIVEEPAGRYGASGGPITQDAFGHPLGTTYLYTCDVNGQNPGSGTGLCLDADGAPVPDVLGSAAIRTDANGVALIKNLPPAKYGIRIAPPAGQGWIQTSTIEGTKTIDAWVKANEPSYFTEFGPPGHHVEFGFVKLMNGSQDNDGNGVPDLSGGSTITGQVVSTHMSRPPNYTFYEGAVFSDVYIGLNNMSIGRGLGVYVAEGGPQSTFSIPGVPQGNYQLVIWDKNLDIVFSSQNVTVNTNGSCITADSTCNLGKVGVFDWFGHVRGRVFNDTDMDGFMDVNENGIPSAVNLRWRDGTIYQATGTDPAGNYAFDETFPFFSWLVAEVDFAAPLKATGMTAVVDAGGPVNTATEAFPGFGRLNPQEQPNGALYRTETGEVLTQAFQAFLGQTNNIDWGKVAYNTTAGENGGISGMAVYKTTRADPNPEKDAALTHEPGIPRVQINLYPDMPLTGTLLADVDNYPFNWYCQGDTPCSGTVGPEDIDRNLNGAFDLNAAIDVTWTDSWDDSQPTDCPNPAVANGQIIDPFNFANRCYDGLRNFNQVRDGVFDGGYAFPGYDAVNNTTGLRPGIYIVEAVPPPNYQIALAQDQNVVFGDTFVPADRAAAGGFPIVPTCVGEDYRVPLDLSLFQGVRHAYYDPDSPLFRGYKRAVHLNSCDRKRVDLRAGQNAAADFSMFTEVPIAAHVTGFILNDLANEFNPLSPNFGEKQALPHLPIAFRDYKGQEVTRVYSDQYGNYNALVPSTFTTNVPSPSGMGPNMLIACMNDPGPMANGQMDPNHNSQYTHFCYTFQYVPGATTYLDTPVENIAAFAGQGQAPLDCDFVDATPVIGRIENPRIVAGGILTVHADTAKPGYGFGATEGIVTLNGAAIDPGNVTWSDQTIAVDTSGLPSGQYQVAVTRQDSLRTSKLGATVVIGGGAATHIVNPPLPGSLATPITDAIEAAAAGDVIVLQPGNYPELVILSKPVRLLGSGAPVTTIQAVKAPGEILQNWRNRITGLVNSGAVDLLPGQTLVFDPANNEPGFLTTAEGPGILVMAQIGAFGTNPNATIANLTVRGSDIAGGIYVNGYAQNLEIANARLINNAGINGGGIVVGHPFIGADDVDAQNDNLNIHHNHITQNGSRSTSVGGGVSLYTGADNYVIADNYICGNFSQGDGGGIGHQGLSDNGLIRDNTIVFNQTFNQMPGTTPGGGGIAIEGFPALTGLTPGSGSVTINGNQIQGNMGGAGDGGGIKLLGVNGQDVAANPTTPANWHEVRIFNNWIVNNLAGMAGGGITLQDTARVSITNNTVVNNDSTATAGVLINPLTHTSSPLPAGVVARAHSQGLTGAFGAGFGQTFSNPVMVNNFVWHNRSFYWSLNANGIGGTLNPNAAPWDYQDLAVLGGAPGDALNCTSCITTATGDPVFDLAYLNTGSLLDIIPENSAPITNAALDEGGNFIDVRFAQIQPAGDYHLAFGSAGIDTGNNGVLAAPLLQTDIDEEARPNNGTVDLGADERYDLTPPPPF